MVETNRIIEKRITSKILYRDMQLALGLMTDRLGGMAGSAKGRMGEDLSEVLCSGGKRLRPILAFMCYRMGGSRETDILPLMCMLELMHTASLIHDDVVDSAGMRRGKPTINFRKGDFAAVQSGDFLLAKAMELLYVYKGMGINEMLADVSYNMTTGELAQQSVRYRPELQSVDSYYDLIYKKTALLFAASCWCGAIAGGMGEEDALGLFRYGEKLGLAFQLRDDLIDYSDESGKFPGQDVRNGMFTLPLLMLLERGDTPPAVRELLIKRDKTNDEVAHLIEFVRGGDALAHTEAAVGNSSHEAISELERFADCPEKKGLYDLASSLMKRQF